MMYWLCCPKKAGFREPVMQEMEMKICDLSGDKAGPFCDNTTLTFVPKSCSASPVCRFHKQVFVEKTSGLRAETYCAEQTQLEEKHFFVLPPLMEFYYRQKHPEYEVLPRWKRVVLNYPAKP
ncbi:MAG: hypothetical protein R2850_01180 [Bacteroidia bacterium]